MKALAVKEKAMQVVGRIRALSNVQKIVLGVGAAVIVGLAGLGIYMAVNHNNQPAQPQISQKEEKKEAPKVEAVKDTKKIEAPVAAQTEEYVAPPANENQASGGESNAATADGYNDNYYIHSDGGRSETPEYYEPAYEEPSYTPPAPPSYTEPEQPTFTPPPAAPVEGFDDASGGGDGSGGGQSN